MFVFIQGHMPEEMKEILLWDFHEFFVANSEVKPLLGMQPIATGSGNLHYPQSLSSQISLSNSQTVKSHITRLRPT
jgi:hypothetical protein